VTPQFWCHEHQSISTGTHGSSQAVHVFVILVQSVQQHECGTFIHLKHVDKINTMDLKRIAMRMKLHKVSGSVVHHCAVLKKLLAEKGVKSSVVHGYCISPGEICEHYWVRTDDEGLDLDIGYELACMYNPDLASLKTFLAEEFPPGLKDADGKEPDVLRQEDNTRLFELYETDPVTFWKEAPKDVRTFR